MIPQSLSYRPDVDGLRAVAVLGVLAYHAGLAVPGGYVGVDVFFVISGFLITSIIRADLDKGSFSAAAFWERRVRRILPALVAVVAATLVVGWFLLLPDALLALAYSVVAVCLISSNVLFYRTAGYFNPAAEEMPLLHTWSLSLEEQFYVALPVLFLVVRRFAHLSSARWVLAVVGVMSFALAAYAARPHPWGTFYMLPTRAWELGAGVALAYWAAPLAMTANSRGRTWREAAAWLGMAMILVAYAAYDDRTIFPGVAAALPVAGAALLIRFAPGTRVAALLSWRPLVFIGLVSYSLYLWHWPIFAFARYRHVDVESPWFSAVAIGLSFLAAVLSWRYIEQPFRNRNFLPGRRRTFVLAAAAMGILLLASAAVHFSRGFEGRVPAGALHYARAAADKAPINEHFLHDIPDGLARIGVLDAPVEVLLWGDSHAMAALPAVDDACRELGIGCRSVTRSGRAPVLDWAKTSRVDPEDGIAFADAVLSHLRSGGEGIHTVILAARWETYFSEGVDFRSALLNTVAELQRDGRQVVFLAQAPRFEHEVPRMLAFAVMRGEPPGTVTMAAEAHEATMAAQYELLPELVRRGVLVVDPARLMTDAGGRIVPFDQHGSLYYDDDHLGRRGSRTLSPVIADAITRGRSP